MLALLSDDSDFGDLLLPGDFTDQNIMDLLDEEELKDPADVLSGEPDQQKPENRAQKARLDEILPNLPEVAATLPDDQGLAQIDSKALEELLSVTGEVLSGNQAPAAPVNNGFPLPSIPNTSSVTTGPHTVGFGPNSLGARSDGSMGQENDSLPSSMSALSTSSQSSVPGNFNADGGPFGLRQDFSGITFNKSQGSQWQNNQCPPSGGHLPQMQQSLIQQGTGITSTHGGGMSPHIQHPHGKPAGIVTGTMGPYGPGMPQGTVPHRAIQGASGVHIQREYNA